LLEDKNGNIIYKLGKKYGKHSKIVEPITTLYLSLNEYETLSILPGKKAKKRRYGIGDGSLDVYVQPAFGFYIYELEFSNEEEANKYSPPGFVSEEITGLEKFSGFSIAQ
jgi:hypothetical protein